MGGAQVKTKLKTNKLSLIQFLINARNHVVWGLPSGHTGKPFTELSANVVYKLAIEVGKIVKQAKKRCIHETECRCVAEYKKQLDDKCPTSCLCDNSLLSIQVWEHASGTIPQSDAHCSKKIRYSLRPDQCDRFKWIKSTLMNWNPAHICCKWVSRTIQCCGYWE